MNKRLALIVGAVAVAASASAVIAQSGFFAPAPSDPCVADSPKDNGDRAVLLSDKPLAISNNQIVVVANGRALDPDRCVPTDGMLRHLAVFPGVGTAFVVDQAGQDVLELVSPEAMIPVASGLEITHPTWSPGGQLAWAENLQVLKVMSPDTTAVSGVVLPHGAVAAFSPLFLDETRVMAVVQEQVGGAPPEDESLNNLWTFDLSSGKWTRRTAFHASGDNWVGIRTPVIAADGTIFFVRITANASATKEPIFELWKFSGPRASKVRTLDGEMYLAGISDDRLVWNVPSRTCGDWGLFIEVSDGLNQIGCGAVMTDPVAIADPDLLMGSEDGGHGEAAPETDELTDLVIIVGDFHSSKAAAAVAQDLARPARVVGNAGARNAVAPGAWAVLVETAPGVGAEKDLNRIRAGLTGCDCGAWLAPNV